jgi:hypothetical protein
MEVPGGGTICRVYAIDNFTWAKGVTRKAVLQSYPVSYGELPDKSLVLGFVFRQGAQVCPN